VAAVSVRAIGQLALELAGEAGVLHGQAGAHDGEVDEAVQALGLALVHAQRHRVELLHLAAELGAVQGGVEQRDRPGPALARDERPPGGLDPDAQGSDQADAGDRDLSHADSSHGPTPESYFTWALM
jgi:hypothetical protein